MWKKPHCCRSDRGMWDMVCKEVIEALLMSSTSVRLFFYFFAFIFLSVYIDFLHSPLPLSDTEMNIEVKFYSFTTIHCLLHPQGNRRRVNPCLSCISAIIIYIHLFNVDLDRNDQWEVVGACQGVCAAGEDLV